MIRRIPFFVIGVGMLALSGCQPAQVTVMSPSGLPQGLQVSGSATVRATPTLVVIRLGCEHSDRLPSNAKKRTDEGIRKVIAAVKAQGVAAEEVQTTDFGLDSSMDSRTKLITWRCVNYLEIRVKDVPKAGQVLEAALNAGANSVNGVDYTIEELQELRVKARDEACTVAKAKAQQLARNLGVTLGTPTSVSEHYPGGWVYNRYAAQQNVMSYSAPEARSNPETILSAGSVSVELTVEVTYALK